MAAATQTSKQQTSAASPQGRYTTVAIALHWIVAGLMAMNLALVWFVNVWPEGWVRPAIDMHKSIGITVLGLALLRLLWRAGNAPPPLPADYARWEKRAAHVGHMTLYAIMIALPLSGWMHDSAWAGAATHPMQLYGLIPWPRISLIEAADPEFKERLHELFGAGHTLIGYALYALFALHVAGALKHQWLDGDQELQRILPRRG